MTQGRISAAVSAVILALSGSAFAATTVFQSSGAGSAPSVRREENVTQVNERLITVQFNLKKMDTRDVEIQGGKFQEVTVDDLSRTSEIGAPALPFYAVTVPVAPEKLKINVALGEAVSVDGLRVSPALPEKCRCADDARNQFTFDPAAYRAPEGFYRVEVLGDFRGTPISRVVLFPHRYDASAKRLTAYPNASFDISVASAQTMDDLILKTNRDASQYDYLVIAPRSFHSAIQPWMSWKTSVRGLRFKVMALEEIGATSAAIMTTIQNEYKSAQFLYALIVGNQNKVPTNTTSTSGGSTPSDLPYFAMGGASDTIPDVFAGRLVVQSPEEITRTLGKFRAYEEGKFDAMGFVRALGVASNEGSGPSDNQYVLSIQNKFQESFGTFFGHFHQNNPISSPNYFNDELNDGAMWVTYMGHGSGDSWPSFGNEYGVHHIKDLDNANVVKPVWIDVACQNGKLVPGGAGERMMNETDANGRPIGLTAYYGGTVNISWHPPAILARGIAFKMIENKDARILGPILQAGHVYLSENYSNTNELKYNQRWYHLQGDPSMEVRLNR